MADDQIVTHSVMRYPSARHTAIKARTRPIPASATAGGAALLCQKSETDPAKQVLRLRDKPFLSKRCQRRTLRLQRLYPYR